MRRWCNTQIACYDSSALLRLVFTFPEMRFSQALPIVPFDGSEFGGIELQFLWNVLVVHFNDQGTLDEIAAPARAARMSTGIREAKQAR